MNFSDSKYERNQNNSKINFKNSSSFISYMRKMQTPGSELFHSKCSKLNRLNEDQNYYVQLIRICQN